MNIDRYRFKNIVIDQVEYTQDLLILPDRVQDGWRRERGHRLSAQDLEPVWAANPDVLIIGAGYFGLVQVPQATRDEIHRRGIELHVLSTRRAWSAYNNLASGTRTVAAALHLAC